MQHFFLFFLQPALHDMTLRKVSLDCLQEKWIGRIQKGFQLRTLFHFFFSETRSIFVHKCTVALVDAKDGVARSVVVFPFVSGLRYYYMRNQILIWQKSK